MSLSNDESVQLGIFATLGIVLLAVVALLVRGRRILCHYVSNTTAVASLGREVRTSDVVLTEDTSGTYLRIHKPADFGGSPWYIDFVHRGDKPWTVYWSPPTSSIYLPQIDRVGTLMSYVGYQDGEPVVSHVFNTAYVDVDVTGDLDPEVIYHSRFRIGRMNFGRALAGMVVGSSRTLLPPSSAISAARERASMDQD